MSISDAIAPHIPFLRRFARALCGTQASGDSYVAATLETVDLSSGPTPATDLNPKKAKAPANGRGLVLCPLALA